MSSADSKEVWNSSKQSRALSATSGIENKEDQTESETESETDTERKNDNESKTKTQSEGEKGIKRNEESEARRD